MRIGQVETRQVETDELIRVGVPVETWIACDFLFFGLDFWKEVSSSH